MFGFLIFWEKVLSAIKNRASTWEFWARNLKVTTRSHNIPFPSARLLHPDYVVLRVIWRRSLVWEIAKHACVHIYVYMHLYIYIYIYIYMHLYTDLAKQEKLTLACVMSCMVQGVSDPLLPCFSRAHVSRMPHETYVLTVWWSKICSVSFSKTSWSPSPTP